MMNLEHMFHF